MNTKYMGRLFVPSVCTLGATFLAMQIAYAVDGVTLINQSKALAGNVTPGDAPGFPVTLTRRGSYRLSSSLRVDSPDAGGIHVQAEDVSIDLNGFTIKGPNRAGSGSGVSAAIGTQAFPITVTNGIVRDFGGPGILCGPASKIVGLHVVANRTGGIVARGGGSIGSIVRENNVTSNGGPGISLFSSGNQVSGNTLWQNTGIGIIAGGACVVKENTVSSSGSHGIQAANGCLVTDNAVRDSGGFDLFLDSDAGYKGNVLTNSSGGSAGPEVSGGIEIGSNVCGSDTICP